MTARFIVLHCAKAKYAMNTDDTLYIDARLPSEVCLNREVVLVAPGAFAVGLPPTRTDLVTPREAGYLVRTSTQNGRLPAPSLPGTLNSSECPTDIREMSEWQS